MLKIFSTNIKFGQYIPDESAEGAIDDDNYENYLVDDVEGNGPTEYIYDELPETETETGQPNFMDELPLGNELLGIPEDTREISYFSPIQLVYDGIDKNEVISFQYTNRHGEYAGLRTVEPHYTFIAKTTGNEVLVTYDRDINDIRAFIVSNIHPQGVRYENVRFEDRPEIMQGVL